ncbi:MAG TPA: tetratricopeptide repeat protein [Gallionellaceae bacterium]|nr:tetratricopeptide repeat protein [Gallionellaceae bacterium]
MIKHRISVSLLLLLMLAGCGSAPPRQPAALEQAGKTEQAAHRAMRDGDLLRARELFHQSMLMQQALDNAPARAQAAINLASVSHKLGDDAAALAVLEPILNEDKPPYPGELRAAAALRKAIILADGGKPADAAWQQAQQECHQSCGYRAGIANLGARLALARGDHASALALAQQGLAASPGQDEQANALRLSAVAETALGQQDKALAHYQGALEIDTSLGLSRRIAADLHGMAEVLGKLGRVDDAAQYARRAAAVDEAISSLSASAGKRAIP